MLKIERVYRQLKSAKEDGRLDANDHALILTEGGIPRDYKTTWVMKILGALDKFMYKS